MQNNVPTQQESSAAKSLNSTTAVSSWHPRMLRGKLPRGIEAKQNLVRCLTRTVIGLRCNVFLLRTKQAGHGRQSLVG